MEGNNGGKGEDGNGTSTAHPKDGEKKFGLGKTDPDGKDPSGTKKSSCC